MVEKSKKERVCLNLILLGQSNVGKTSLMIRYLRKKFNADVANTIGVDYMKCIYKS